MISLTRRNFKGSIAKLSQSMVLPTIRIGLVSSYKSGLLLSPLAFYQLKSSYIYCEVSNLKIKQDAIRPKFHIDDEIDIKTLISDSCKHKEYSLLEKFLRSIQLLWIFSSCLITFPVLYTGNKRLKEWWYSTLRKAIENSGPAFIKWGQWGSTRYDLFPPSLTDELSKLTNSAPIHEYEITRKMIEEAFCCPVDELFSEFNPVPVASGSIAQIYKAKLNPKYKPKIGDGSGVGSDSGYVAIKVRHPNTLQLIEIDFSIIKTLARLFNLFPRLKSFRIGETIEQFNMHMSEQTDFRIEAYNLRKFESNFKKSHLGSKVTFPKPIPGLTTSAILVETFEEGHSVAYYLELADKENSKENCETTKNSNSEEEVLRESVKHSLAALGTQVLLKMIMMDNLIHADLHPGNVLVRKLDSVSEKPWWKKILGFQDDKVEPKIVLLDAGLAAVLTDEHKSQVNSFFSAVIGFDGVGLAEAILSMSESQPHLKNRQLFISEVVQSIDNIKINLASMRGADCMGGILEIIRDHQVCIDPNIMVCVITTLVLEGWQNRLDPNLVMIDHISETLDRIIMVEKAIDNVGSYLCQALGVYSDDELMLSRLQKWLNVV